MERGCHHKFYLDWFLFAWTSINQLSIAVYHRFSASNRIIFYLYGRLPFRASFGQSRTSSVEGVRPLEVSLLGTSCLRHDAFHNFFLFFTALFQHYTPWKELSTSPTKTHSLRSSLYASCLETCFFSILPLLGLYFVILLHDSRSAVYVFGDWSVFSFLGTYHQLRLQRETSIYEFGSMIELSLFIL